MTQLRFTEVIDGTEHETDVSRLLVAGFTGRDQEAVDEHIEELATMGVPVPDSTPSLYRLDPGLLEQTERIAVAGRQSSGEVEPVVVRTQGRWLLTIGSDHTDRALEREDITRSKAACPKVVGTSCVELSRVDQWDEIIMSSYIDDGETLYQEGQLAALLPLDEILTRLSDKQEMTPADGDVLFLGTLPARGGIRPSPTFHAALRVPGIDQELTLSYSVATTDEETR